MTEQHAEPFAAFLRGEQSLTELQAALAAAVASDPAAGSRLRARVDELYRSGRLPLQVHRILTGIVDAGAWGAEAESSAPVEATRLRSGAGTEATRLKAPVAEAAGASPGGGGAGEVDAVGADDATRVKAPGPVEPTRLKKVPTGGMIPSEAHSDWAHPEQWETRAETVGPGSVIKQRFVLEEILGQGGMGIVYRAVDRRKLEAQDREPHVAIKILSEEFRRHPNALIALQREARKAQTLAHPNIITVHDFDRDGTTVYMTMELLDGDPLDRVIAARLGGLPRDQAVPIVHGMAGALAYAHQKGIVHSDLKPGNIFLTRRGEVKVLDFGIARAVPTQLRPDADRTVFDATELGALTPAYASPEMLDGEAPAPADDVFALGVVAHELLTGRHPFDRVPADDARRRRLKPVAIPALSRRQRRAMRKALSFEREARQADAEAFLRELQGPSPLRKAAYAGVLVALSGVAAYGLYQAGQIRPDVPFEELPPEVQQAFNQAMADGQTALGFGTQALDDAFTYFDRAYGIHRNNPEAVRGLRAVADRFLAQIGSADVGQQRSIVRKLYCHEHLANYAPVSAACENTLQLGSCTAAAVGCPSSERSP